METSHFAEALFNAWEVLCKIILWLVVKLVLLMYLPLLAVLAVCTYWQIRFGQNALLGAGSLLLFAHQIRWFFRTWVDVWRMSAYDEL